MKPSDIKLIFPADSVLKDYDCETVAQNIAQILARTGDNWRMISCDEYADERRKDSGRIPQKEYVHFNKCIKYFKSEDTVRLFSNEWSL